jgi:hypothetical protein
MTEQIISPPNLAGIIRKDDVYTKGTGSYAASYVPWARIAQLLHEHAPGWDFALKLAEGGGPVHKAPDGTGYVLGYFAGPDGFITSDFPFPCMDHRNNPITFDKISARVLTDTHRRALCAAAAFHFSLGYELWAKQELEDAKAEPAPAATSKPQKPASPEPEADGTKAASGVMQSGMKAIRGASTLQQLEAVGQRLVARHEAGDLTDEEQQALLQLMLDRETELTAKN